MKRLIALAVIGLLATALGMNLLASKADASVSTVYYDKQTTGWGVDRAARLWTETGIARLVPVDDCAALADCFEVRQENLGAMYVGVTVYPDVDIVMNLVNRGDPLAVRRQATCHEFGHVLGLSHSPGSCMESRATGRYTTP